MTIGRTSYIAKSTTPIDQRRAEVYVRAFERPRPTSNRREPSIADFSLGRVLAAITGCSSPSSSTPFTDSPLPFPDVGNAKDGAVFDDAQNSQDESILCNPDQCTEGVLSPSPTVEGEFICIAFEEVHQEVGLQSFLNHQGLSVVDLNQDGWLDIYLLNHQSPNEFYQNNQGVFAEHAQGLGLDFNNESRDAVWRDLDGDQNLDLFLVAESGSRLYQNRESQFVELNSPQGIEDFNSGTTATWLSSGFYLGTQNGTRFYHHVGDWIFEEKALELGLDDINEAARFAVGDYDQDGHLDVFVANVVGENRLFHNRGDDRYESVEDLISRGATGSTDAQWVVYQEEAQPSLYVSNFERNNQFFTREGENFTDQAAALGLQDPGPTVRAAWGDFLNQNKPGVFLARWEEESLLYVPEWDESNQNIERYHEMTRGAGIDVKGQVTDAQWLDYNNDGLLDLLVVMAGGGIYLYKNKTRILKNCF